MKQMFAIAKFSLIENISNKIFNGFVFFGLLVMFSTVLLKDLALYEEARVIKDTGLFLIEIFVLLITIYSASTQFLREQKEKSLYLVLTKPVSRNMYITGKILGIMSTIFFNVFFMGIVLALVVMTQKLIIDFDYFVALFFIFLKLSVLGCIGVLFSIVSDSYVTSNIFTFSIYIIAHTSSELKEIGNRVGSPFMKLIIDFLYYILPNFSVINVKDYLKLGEVDLRYIVLYTFGYILVVVGITNLIFSRKKL